MIIVLNHLKDDNSLKITSYMLIFNPDRIEDFNNLREELNSTLENIKLLEEKLDELLDKEYKLKAKADHLYYLYYAQEKNKVTSKKRTITEIKEAIKLKLFENSIYIKYLDYEEKKELIKRKIRLFQTKADLLKLKLETLK